MLGTVFLPFLFQFFGRCFSISTQEHQINEEINDKEVRLIDADGSQLGVVTIQRALEVAAERNLDLVKIAPKAEPPVCRVMDYGKFRFEQAKKEKEARKNQKVLWDLCLTKPARIRCLVKKHGSRQKKGCSR